ncbi:MAG: hypothetical protein WCF65_00015 [Parachlamydiaceae bacterium]
MNELSDDKLFSLNKIGIIPGPNETPEDFAKRAEYCLHLLENFPDELKNSLNAEASSAADVLNSPINLLAIHYDISPRWIPLVYSNHRLPFWHGGCAWIYQLTEETPTAALIQLRRHFKNASHYLKIYDRKELLTHELCHVGRMMFQEPKFEEVIAYNTSPYSFRRWLGPLAQSSIESVMFVLIIFMILVFDVFLISTHRPDAYMMALWLKLVPALLILGALTRLWGRHSSLQKCTAHLADAVGEKHAHAVLYRLTDAEIIHFSKITPPEIKKYASAESKNSLRWHVIKQSYFT